MADDSAEVLSRPAPPPDTVEAYGTEPDQEIDVWLPAEEPAGGAPLAVVLHGGFWRAATDRRHVGSLAADLAARGWVVAVPEYARTGGRGGWPATFDDVAAAVDAAPGVVAAVAQDRGVTLSGQHLLLGHSAGGHLALWAAARHVLPAGSRWHRDRDPALLGVLALAAVACLVEAARHGVGGDATYLLMKAGPDEAVDRWAQADPSLLVPTGVPTVLVHGADDPEVPVSLAHAFADAARAAGDLPDLRVLPGVEHYALIDPAAPAWTEVVAALDALRVP